MRGTKEGRLGQLRYDPQETRQLPISKVKILNGPKNFIGLIGDVISVRSITSLSQTNGENTDGLDRNCLVVRLLSDQERKGYSYFVHLMEGDVEYISEGEVEEE